VTSKTPEEPEGKSHDTLQAFPYRQGRIRSGPGPSSSITTAALSPTPSDWSIAPLDPISFSLVQRSSEKDLVPTTTTNLRPQPQMSQGASDAAPADSPSTVAESSRQPGAEHSDGDSEASLSHEHVSSKSKKKRTRTLTTAPQAAALFALLARVSPDCRNLCFVQD
jgi:hypothetical protein